MKRLFLVLLVFGGLALAPAQAADGDSDGLDDGLEQSLLSRFRPYMVMSKTDKEPGPVYFQKNNPSPVVTGYGGLYGVVNPRPGYGCPKAAAARGMCAQAQVSVEMKIFDVWAKDHGVPPEGWSWYTPWCIPGITSHTWDPEGGIRVLVSAPSWDSPPDQWRVWKLGYHRHGFFEARDSAPGIGENDGQHVGMWISKNKHGAYVSQKSAERNPDSWFCDRLKDPGTPSRASIPENVGALGKPLNGNLWTAWYADDGNEFNNRL
ncbi:MAG: hypothetical protein HY558_03595 [Euryarchaeota archaeon]|nr:hypothetical protein [Euryarchaeota archaeon]